MKIEAVTRQIKGAAVTPWLIKQGEYNEFYLPALMDTRQDMFIKITDDKGVETIIHLKR